METLSPLKSAIPDRRHLPSSTYSPWRPNAGCRGISQTALITIRDLRLRTFIGFNTEEKTKQQDVVINIEIAYELSPGVFNDHVVDALDYKRITKQVIEHVEGGRFLLLEKLVADVLSLCCVAEEVVFARVSIDKPHALRFADSVSLTLEYHAEDSAGVQEKLR